MVEFVDATAADLAEVVAAQEAFRRHWGSFHSMPFAPAFDGGPDDVRALDHLDYEQLGYPDGGLAAAALVWGNVLVVRAGLRWVRASGGGLWLGGGDLGTALLWQYARLAEAKARAVPQFYWHRALMLRVVEELIEWASVTADTHVRLRRLQTSLEVGEQVGEPGAAASRGVGSDS